MKPICVKCQRFYRPAKNGFYFIEGMPKGGDVQHPMPGTAQAEEWTPYKVWAGDKWECKGCGHELVVGVIGGPIAEHYQPEFKDVVERLDASQLQVNDC